MDWLFSIADSLGGFAAAIGQILQWLFNLIVAVAQFIWSALQLVAQVLLTVAKAVGNFFIHLWENFFKGIFTKVVGAIRSATQWLETHLRPLINFIKTVQKLWLSIYTKYIRPILNMLNHVRQVLRILSALGFKFAKVLDAKIAQVEGEIQKAFLAVNAVLNATISLLNIIADPSKLLRRPTMLLSFRNIFHALIRSVTGLPPAFFFPAPPGKAKKGAAAAGVAGSGASAPGAPAGVLGVHFLPSNFDPSDPSTNPPPSYYLGLDWGVPDLSTLPDDVPIPDELADTVGALNYFQDDLSDITDCPDPQQCLVDAALAALKGEFADVNG